MAQTSITPKRNRSRKRSDSGLNRTGYVMPLKLAILESGRSQMALASETGIHYSQISHIVRGWRQANASEREKLSAALGRSEGELFPGVAA